MIKISNVSKTFTNDHLVHALRSVSLEVAPGEITGIIGLSGAGKSTLLRMINGLEQPDKGEVYINGKSLMAYDLAELRKNIGMIFQHFNLLSSRSVYGNVALPLEITGVSKQEQHGKVKELLGLVGLSDKEKSPISKLSGGQKQRVAIARALANKPQILLCDEATSALDPITTSEVLLLIKKLSKEMNLTVVLITHEMSVVSKICDKVAVIDDGCIVEYGTVSEVFSSPKSLRTQAFIRAV